MMLRVIILSLFCLTNAHGTALLLELGSADSPFRLPSGADATIGDLDNIRPGVFDLEDNFVGEADTIGLDVAGNGHFIGTINLNSSLVDARLKVVDWENLMIADLADATAEDAFLPLTDPASHRVSATDVVWQPFVYHALTIDSAGPGAIDNVAGEYAEFDNAELTATAGPLHEFVKWTGDLLGVLPEDTTNNPLLLPMDRTRQVEAVFGPVINEDWAVRHFGTTAIDPEADADADSVSNRDEFRLGTDPQSGTTTSDSVSVTPGWNLIAPTVQPGTSLWPAAITVSWSWNALEHSFVFDRTVAGKTGYWIHSTEQQDVAVTGQEIIDNTLLLYTGWNLVGVAQTVATPASNATIWTWDNVAARYMSVDNGQLAPSVGYWILAVNDAVVDLTP